MSLAESTHLHGWCRACKTRRVSRDSACLECGGLLEDVEAHEGHPPVEGVVAGVPAKILGELLEDGWTELTEERFTAFQRIGYVLGGRNRTIARALRSGALAATPAPSILDMAGTALLLASVFLLALCIPGCIARARRWWGWNRVERTLRGRPDGFLRSEVRGLRERRDEQEGDRP